MSEPVITDARLYFHTEKSNPVFTLCVEEAQGDTRLSHQDFYLDLEHVLLLKKSIDVLELEGLRDL